MFYPEDIVEEVRRRNDIVDVISPYVKLTRRGGNYFGLCPFHSEKTPSFSVSPQKQMYYCFGCGAGGNSIGFIMEYENYSFQEALKVLANRAGVTLPEVEQTEEEKRAASVRQQLYDVYRDAATFYYYLLRSPAGAKGMEYLRGRKLTDETINRFGLGFAHTSGGLYRYLKEKKGYPDEVLSRSGLFKYSESGERRVYDAFWNRVMFPIMDARHRVIAFGGRVMGEGEPKYVNSPATDIFDKSNTLYGLNFAKSSRRKYFLQCEGYMDVIALHQAGFDCAVASLGTSFTSGHAMIIKRHTKDVILTLDSDGAGRKAALRAIPILKNAGLDVRVLSMKPYKDPDEFIKAMGSEAYEERIKQAANAFYFQSDMLREEYDLTDPGGKTQFQRALAESLTQFRDELERNNYLEAVASRYQIDQRLLRDEVARLGGRAVPINPETGDEPERRKKRTRDSGITETERLVLSEAFSGGIPGDVFVKLFTPEDFSEGVHRELAEVLADAVKAGARLSPAELLNRYAEDSELSGRAAAVFSASLPEDADPDRKKKILQESIRRLRRLSVERRSAELEADDRTALMELMRLRKRIDTETYEL